MLRVCDQIEGLLSTRHLTGQRRHETFASAGILGQADCGDDEP